MKNIVLRAAGRCISPCAQESTRGRVRVLYTSTRPKQTSQTPSRECSSISNTFYSSSSSPDEEGCTAHGAALVCQHRHAAPPDSCSSPGSAAAAGDEQLEHGSSGERPGSTAGALPNIAQVARERRNLRKSGCVWGWLLDFTVPPMTKQRFSRATKSDPAVPERSRAFPSVPERPRAIPSDPERFRAIPRSHGPLSTAASAVSIVGKASMRTTFLVKTRPP